MSEPEKFIVVSKGEGDVRWLIFDMLPEGKTSITVYTNIEDAEAARKRHAESGIEGAEVSKVRLTPIGAK